MGRARFWDASGVIGAVLFLGATASPSFADQSPLPRIKIRVCDQVGLSKEMLMEAQKAASVVFREAAIELLWMEVDQSSVAEADYLVRIHCCFDRLKTSLHHRTLGFAPAGGRHITIFWDRIRAEAAAGSYPGSQLLGFVMAHELGHLLLPPGHHSAYGIMRSRLSYDDWRRIRRICGLFFSRKEAELMRAALAGRSR